MDIPITILIPVYNGSDFFDECITSILEQTYTLWKVIIGVNGHGDDNNIVYKTLQDKIKLLNDSRISIINLPNVKGAAEAINTLVKISTTDWVAHLDIDDKWHPQKLELQVYVANYDASGCDVIGTLCQYFGEWNTYPRIENTNIINKEIFYTYNPMIHSSILIKKNLAYYTNEFVCYDYDCWARLVLNNVKFFNVPLRLTLHRVHKNSFYNASGNQDPDKVRAKYF